MSDKNPLLSILNKALEDAHAIDITVIDVRKHTAITDYMIVCTGRASRHVKAIANQIIICMKSAGLPPLYDSGLDAGDWALVDFGDFVVHIMQPDCRLFYNLEALWQDKRPAHQ